MRGRQTRGKEECLAGTFKGCTCHTADGGRGRLLLQKLTLEFFNVRNGVRKNRERASSEDKIKVENRVPLSI